MTAIDQAQAHNLLLQSRKRQLLKRRILSESLGIIGWLLPDVMKRVLSRMSPKMGYLYFGEPEMIIQDYCEDISMYIDVRNNTERQMLTGKYDLAILNLIQKEVSDKMVCLDIGANVGALTLPLARQVGPQGQVLAFEPGLSFFERLKKNLQINPKLKGRVSLFQIGLSYEPGTLQWSEDPEFPGNAWLLGKSGIEVPVNRLDSVLEPLNLHRLDLIKIDVEGMEWEVFKGAEATLKKFHPKIIFESTLEFEIIRNQPVRKQALEFLESLNYKVQGIDSKGNLVAQTYPNLQPNSFANPA